MMKLQIITYLLFAGLFTVSAQAALHDRGNGMIYDDELEITWLKDANYAHTSNYAANNATGSLNSSSTNIQDDGSMGWDAAKAWAAQLVFHGHDEWRLPSSNLIDPGNTCCNLVDFSEGEMGHMYYNNLGNTLQDSTINKSYENGSGNTINILNLQEANYWLEEEAMAYSAWNFNAGDGFQTSFAKQRSYYAWAVHDGDVSAVPIPAAAWLFSSALIGLIGLKRKT